MKSNYEIEKIKGLQLATLEDWGGMGILQTKDIPQCSVVFTRKESGKYDHVSIAPADGHTPTWGEMCKLKELFFNDDEEVVQIHPKLGEYVNLKENCLHLWHRIDGLTY